MERVSYELTTAQSRLLFRCLADTKCSVGDLLGLLSQVARSLARQRMEMKRRVTRPARTTTRIRAQLSSSPEH